MIVYLYLLLNAMIVLFPLALSFEKRIGFYRKWKYLIIPYLTVGSFFIIWDILATRAGHWDFNDEYLIGWKFLGLPIEEILFFLTVPYACIFTYEIIIHYVKDRKFPFNRWIFLGSGTGLIVLGIVFWNQGYTRTVLFVTGGLLVYMSIRSYLLLRSSNFWIYVLITFVLFLIFNSVLTAIPIVTYGSDSIWGGDGYWNGRLLSIPFEDILYNFSMLTLFLIVYLTGRSEDRTKQ